MGQKVCSGLPYWIFHASQHMASLDDITGKEEASLVPEWSFICRGFPYIGGFQHWNPATILPVGLPVSHMLKYSLNSGRGSILTTLHPWHFLKELKDQQTRAHKDAWLAKLFTCVLSGEGILTSPFPPGPPRLWRGPTRGLSSLDPLGEHTKANWFASFQP